MRAEKGDSLTIPSKKSRKKTANPAHVLALQAVEALQEKKALSITIMDMRAVSGVADYFVLCTGSSDLHIKAIVDAVNESIKKHCKERAWHIEGYQHLQWVLLDYVDLVVHVFTDEKRSFYNLERLWGDAPLVDVSEETVLSEIPFLTKHPAGSIPSSKE